LRRTSRLILLLGIFLAALTFVVIIVLFNPTTGGIGGPAVTAPPTDRSVVVATVDIPLGTLVTAEMVTSQTMSLTVANPHAFADPSQAIGQTNKQAITAGQQVTSDQFSGTAAQELVVPVGKRAFPISVNELTGVANLVQVGDYVDVLITEHIVVVQKDSTGAIVPVVGISDASTVKLPLLLQEIQVIGTLDAVAPAPPAQGATPSASTAPTITGQSKLLILAVTPAQAEVLLFARTSGTIDVILRSPLDATVTAVTDGVILKTLIDKYGVLPPNIIVVSVP
jgi:pilus assembly protein CpaB